MKFAYRFCVAALRALRFCRRPSPAGDPDRGEKVYEGCQDCHSLDKNDVGPRHRGVFGRKAGSLAGLRLFAGAERRRLRLERGDPRQMADQPAGLCSRGRECSIISAEPGTAPTSSRSCASARNSGMRTRGRMTGRPPNARFREIVLPHLDDAYSLAKWLSGSGADAEDIVQDAALRALAALEAMTPLKPRAWWLGVVRNTALTWMARAAAEGAGVRRRPRRPRRARARRGAAPDPEAALIARDEGERVRRAIAALPSPLRETLVLREIDELDYREIAEATEAPIGTVMSRLARARQALAKRLGKAS